MEREVVDAFREYHFTAHRVPLSGAADGFPGDVRVTVTWQPEPPMSLTGSSAEMA